MVGKIVAFLLALAHQLLDGETVLKTSSSVPSEESWFLVPAGAKQTLFVNNYL